MAFCYYVWANTTAYTLLHVRSVLHMEVLELVQPRGAHVLQVGLSAYKASKAGSSLSSRKQTVCPRGTTEILPHSLCGVVEEVLPELRHPKHGLQEERGEAEQLNVEAHSDQKKGDSAPNQGEDGDKETVVFVLSPLPEVFRIEVCVT